MVHLTSCCFYVETGGRDRIHENSRPASLKHIVTNKRPCLSQGGRPGQSFDFHVILHSHSHTLNTHMLSLRHTLMYSQTHTHTQVSTHAHTCALYTHRGTLTYTYLYKLTGVQTCMYLCPCTHTHRGMHTNTLCP